MASIRKRGKRWTAEIRLIVDNKKIYESKTFSTKNEAIVWAAQQENLYRLGQYSNIKDHRTFRDALIRYRDEEIPKKGSKRGELSAINRFLNDNRFNWDIRITRLTRAMLLEYRRSLEGEISNSTINRYFNVIRSTLRMAVSEWEWLNENPYQNISRLKEETHRDRRINDDETIKLMEDLGFCDQPPTNNRELTGLIFLFALETAMRRSEILNLKWKDLHLDQQYLHIPQSKNGDPRDVPLSRRAIELIYLIGIKERGHVFNIVPDTLSITFRRARDRCKIKDLTFHDTRHEAITRLAQKLHILDLAKMTGHRNPSSLMIYYNPTATEIANLLD